MIDLRLWRSFVVLAEELNFRRAAERLGLSQPALTKQIQELEARLRVDLFLRETKGLRPTAAAASALPDAQRLLQDAQALTNRIAGGDAQMRATLRIGALEYISRWWIAPLLAELNRLAPAPLIEFENMTPIEAVGATADAAIDLGLTLLPVVEPSLVAKPILEGQWMILAPADHPVVQNDQVEASDLRNHPLIMFARRLNPDLYDRLVATLRGPSVVYHAQDPAAAPALVESRIGLFLVANYALPDLPASVIARPVFGLGSSPTLALVWRPDRMTPALRAAIDFLTGADAPRPKG